MTDRNILKVDLHTHSTASDGTLAPRRLASEAARLGLCAAALTDHDTIDGLSEFHEECEKLGIEGISGVELSAKYRTEMHIVGLFINENDEFLNEKLRCLKKERAARNVGMITLLKENGIDIGEGDILKGGAKLHSVGRAHMARAMTEKGYTSSMDEAFDKYLKKGCPCYVERMTYSPKESIEMVKRAGGFAILAHPIYITKDYGMLRGILCELKEYGLDGTECLYNCYTEEFADMCRHICDEIGLIQSGGSDFHGKNKPNVHLGKVSSGYVPYRILLNMKEMRGTKHMCTMRLGQNGRI